MYEQNVVLCRTFFQVPYWPASYNCAIWSHAAVDILLVDEAFRCTGRKNTHTARIYFIGSRTAFIVVTATSANWNFIESCMGLETVHEFFNGSAPGCMLVCSPVSRVYQPTKLTFRSLASIASTPSGQQSTHLADLVASCRNLFSPLVGWV